jgi:hypothetical protein
LHRLSPPESPTQPRPTRVLAAIGLFVVTAALAGPDRVDPVTGAATWEIRTEGVALSLTQLLPDQVRAFYVNRGFDLAHAEVFATACVYMAVMRNESAPGLITFRQADWEIRTDDGARPLPTLTSWLDAWQERGVPDAARLAFRWAQLPAEQRYAPGEWNQGMLATGLPPGSRFDLIARWTRAGQTHAGRLSDVRCPD